MATAEQIKAEIATSMSKVDVLRGRRHFSASPYGKKGGSSATAGKKMTTYLVRLPDGTETQKRSAYVGANSAVANIYEHNGVWYVACIKASVADSYPHYRHVAAVAI